MLAGNPEQYRKMQIETASGVALVLMMYDRAISLVSHAQQAMKQGQHDKVSNSLNKAHAILGELAATLDFEAGDIASRLAELYGFCNDRMLRANLKHSPDMLDAVVSVLRTIREAWVECMKASRRVKPPSRPEFQAVVQ